jgi:cytochrome c oxidase subunit 2
VPSAVFLTGCRGWQSALDPQTPQAQSLADLLWVFTAVVVLVWLATLAMLAWALWRRRQGNASPVTADTAAERRTGRLVAYATGGTGLILLVLTGLSYAAQKHLFVEDAGVRTVTVTGRQWWWEIRYAETDGTASFMSANELHLPLGEPVRVKLASADVIHSFWVPNLFGKRDLVPGVDNAVTFAPARLGTWRGQCAEFCGLQHAHMALFVTIESKAEFERWREEQAAPATASTSSDAQAGHAIFFSRSCNVCHTIRGTPATGEVGPDLTHFASRQWMAAGVVRNSRAALERWITNPHDVKPGVHMPSTSAAKDELDRLVAFLESLK